MPTGATMGGVRRRHGIGPATFCVTTPMRLKMLEAETAKLRRIVVGQMPDRSAIDPAVIQVDGHAGKVRIGEADGTLRIGGLMAGCRDVRVGAVDQHR
jgi:hypothetical protein